MGNDNLNGLLAEFVDWSKEILAENLAGIYLHGSAVMGCYNPKKSDIDIIITLTKPDLFLYSTITRQLETVFGRHVDLISSKSRLPESFRKHLEKEVVYVD